MSERLSHPPPPPPPPPPRDPVGAARMLPKNPPQPEREPFPIIPPKGREKKSCCA